MRKALVVGINDYASCPLRGCVNDAKAVAKLLERNEDGKKNFDVQLKENVRTKGELLALVDTLFGGTDDIALLYFSGHGYSDKTGGYIVTPDFGKYDPGVAMKDLMNIANNSACKNKIIILDCCHAGSAGNMSGINEDISVLGKGVTLLTASKSDESAMEINGHGVFTKLLLEALNGGAANIQGNITPGSIYAYIDQALGAWEQRPVFKTNIQQFVSVRTVNSKVTLNDLNVIKDCFVMADAQMSLDPSFEFTNTPEYKNELIEPYAIEENVKTFKKLQKLEAVGLVEPVNEEHMYFAAMHSKSCQLTTLGKYYWYLLKEGRI